MRKATRSDMTKAKKRSNLIKRLLDSASSSLANSTKPIDKIKLEDLIGSELRQIYKIGS